MCVPSYLRAFPTDKASPGAPGCGMNLWWIGNLVLLVVVAPAVTVLLLGLLRQVNRLNRLADEILEHGVGVTAQLDALPALAQTKELTSAAHGLVGRYGAGLLGAVRSGS